MSPPNLHTLLPKILALTNERDAAVLEKSLIQTLDGLISPDHAQTAGLATSSPDFHAVSIFRIADPDKQIYTCVSTRKGKGTELSPALKDAISLAFKSGLNQAYTEGDVHSKLYPLKNSNEQTVAIVALELHADPLLQQPGVVEFDQQLHDIITMILQIYQNFTGLIIDNERDTLTGLLNRKTFEHKINKVFARLLKNNQRKDDQYKHYCFLAIFDIDHFKHVNDDFGHLIGDEVLLLFSQLLTKCFRDEDMLFRFGGEEFVGIFECDPQDIQAALERFREKVSQFAFPQVGEVTVSSGYTEIQGGDAPTQLIDRADLALYYAKNNGRNRICHYEQLIADGALVDNKREGDIELF